MKIILEIDDQHLAALEQFAAEQLTQVPDEFGGARMKRVHKDGIAVIESAVQQLVEQIARRFPSDELRAHMKAEKEAKDRIAAMTSVKRSA